MTTSWKEEGIQEGIQRGVQQGRQLGEADVILRLITRRFGTLDSAIEARIRELPIDQLNALTDSLSDFAALADLAAWLDQHAPVVSTNS